MKYNIAGIQQVGIGVDDLYPAWRWYRKQLGFDVRIFDDASIAKLMLPYTGGEPRKRHAVLAFNLQGGGGIEVWQHKGKKPQFPDRCPQLGDTGILVTKIKSHNIRASFNELSRLNESKNISELVKDPSGRMHFLLRDPWGNLFQILEQNDFFSTKRPVNHGVVAGVIIGVTNVTESLRLYQGVLGYDQVASDLSGHFVDLESIDGSYGRFRRVLLRHSKPRKGAFAPLLGPTEIELIQALDKDVTSLYKGRMWGDPGFIHLCFDVYNMDELRIKCRELGFPFTVDSANSFDMGEAAGHFSYIEDRDGTLIEFVETHRIPLIKKLGWYLDLRKRNPEKPLPTWIIQAMRFNRVK
jgi:catechol 2,3-dioxygenase-like lactoylglutathione lyase family enzyme